MKTESQESRTKNQALWTCAFLCAGLLAVVSCGESSGSGSSLPNVDPTDTTLGASEDMPGLVVDIVSLDGASGYDGAFQVGDIISVRFTVTKSNGTRLPLSEVDGARIWVAGPSFNYQHLIPGSRTTSSLTDVKTASVMNGDGSYTYTITTPIPSTYPVQLWDTTKFTTGELTGQALLSGTYRVSMYAYKNYTVTEVNASTTTYRDVGNATEDFRFGDALSLEPREVVKTENCNQCHITLQMHGGAYRDTKLCVTCHTSGAEDRNSEDTGDSTNVTVDFRVMIHKIHNGAHLPSVNGVTTNSSGARVYGSGTAYQIIGYGPTTHDFSSVGFPVWPNMSLPMPRDSGYGSLSTTNKSTEDTIRKGVTACSMCHGDPDGSGHLTAPAQGGIIYAQASRRVCGSCHDDVNWDYPYVSNGQTMPAQSTDSSCMTSDCHGPTASLAIENVHVHPMNNASLNTGANVTLSSVTPSSGSTLEAGEKLSATFSLTNDAGANLTPTDWTLYTAISGPTSNYNLIVYSTIPAAALGSAADSYTINLPAPYYLEFLGDSTATTGDVFTTSRTPVWTASGVTTTVYVRTATSGGDSTLSSATTIGQNYVDVASATNFARGDTLVVDDGVADKEEYLTIQYVDGTRLWFAHPTGLGTYGPWLRVAHSSGASVKEVTLTSKTSGTNYTLTAATGTITEVTEFGTGNAVVVSYTSDFVMPSTYPPAINNSATLTETSGKWTGKTIESGTYTVGIWATKSWTYNPFGDGNSNHNNSYRVTSPPATKNVLVGASTTSETAYGLISSGSNCDTCHVTVLFHGGSRRGFGTCILCHGTAGAEDRPQYVAPNAPATSGVTVSFRGMLHKIHMGEDLTNASTYTVVGYGSSSYPNNYTAYTYEEVAFPPMPGEAKHCTKCHGSSNTAWQTPSARNHSTDQTNPTLVWNAVCSSCHDSDTTAAHISTQTPGGVEGCSTCHGTSGTYKVELVHKNR